MPASLPYINAIELDIVPAEFEKFKAAILENAAASAGFSSEASFSAWMLSWMSAGCTAT